MLPFNEQDSRVRLSIAFSREYDALGVLANAI